MTARLAIVAGGGDLPARLAQACRAAGRDVYVLALEEQAEPAILADVPHSWIRLGAGGEALRRLHAWGAEELVFAGRVRRPSLRALRPDGVTARFLGEVGMRALGDDSLLRLVIERVEREGFRIVSPAAVLADLVAPRGVFGQVAPDETAERDIARGLDVAAGLGTVDVGQAVVVQHGIVLALEAIEGTDAMIARAGDLRRDGPGGVLVKLCKPGQDRRVDLPVIGPETVRRAAAAGLRGIAVEAGSTLVVDRAELVATADAEGLFVVGIARPDGSDPSPT